MRNDQIGICSCEQPNLKGELDEHNKKIHYFVGNFFADDERGDGTLRWESHAGLSGLKTGKCLIIGNVLVIGPSERERPGYLKREFLEHLNRLPPWDKTEYYCPSHVLYRCQTGARISFDARQSGSRDERPYPARNHGAHNGAKISFASFAMDLY